MFNLRYTIVFFHFNARIFYFYNNYFSLKIVQMNKKSVLNVFLFYRYGLNIFTLKLHLKKENGF